MKEKTDVSLLLAIASLFDRYLKLVRLTRNPTARKVILFDRLLDRVDRVRVR